MEVFQPRNKKHNQSSSRPKAAKRRRIVGASVRASHLLRSRFPGAGSDLGRALQKTVMQCKITKGEAVEVDDEEEEVGGGCGQVAAPPFYVETKRWPERRSLRSVAFHAAKMT